MKARPNVAVTFKVTMELTESEARALDALAGYGTDEFLKVFYQHLGKAYLSPYEHGLRTLFDSVKSQIVGALRDVDQARERMAKVKADA